MTFTVDDGGESCTNNIIPFKYVSKEAAEYDILTLLEKAKADNIFCSNFLGVDLYFDSFFWIDPRTKKEHYNGPTILTLEEWFESNTVN